tara:strand:- start:1643 stop:1876 length:234 start_codon:yes stop_codon:yes gene_type:complete
MNTKEILNSIYEELEIESVKELDSETVYKDLEEWDSMAVIILIGFFEENFSITISGETLNELKTFGDIFKKLKIDDK